MTGWAVLGTALAVPATIGALVAWNVARSAWRSWTYRGWHQ